MALFLVALTGPAVEEARHRSEAASATTARPGGPSDAADAMGPAPARAALERPVADERRIVAPEPVGLTIPAIGVDVALVGVGRNDDGSMEVPAFGLAGWYLEGPRPGATGPAVIVAHYDSTAGPDVFYDLGALTAGDRIFVARDDGSTATFVVQGREQRPKEALPGDRIWAPSAEPRLTLITCGGVFDRGTGHYTDNVIVYARTA